jgi:hypothetical protein
MAELCNKGFGILCLANSMTATRLQKLKDMGLYLHSITTLYIKEWGFGYRTDFYVFTRQQTQNLDVIIHKPKVNQVQNYLSKSFGGETSIIAKGSYIADNGKKIEEDVVIVTSYADLPTFMKKRDKLVSKIKSWRDKWEQESVSYMLEDDLYLI